MIAVRRAAAILLLWPPKWPRPKPHYQTIFLWRSADNQNISMTKEDVLAFHGAMTDWIHANYKASWDHKTAINGLMTFEAVEEYNIQQGWPDNTIV